MSSLTARASRGIALLALAALAISAEEPPEPHQLEPQLTRFVEVFNLLDQKLADPIDPADAVYKGAIPAMLWRLDPHSAFLDPQQFENLKEMQRATEKGFGIVALHAWSLWGSSGDPHIKQK